ncbi:MAG: PilT/PilU family type 4a pilus ATPase [Candidatus Riflebacteria bacterium]|nr:PilT/PilU family type 4a pilus ATPase [Candidatus Riflebacteria bacterium]
MAYDLDRVLTDLVATGASDAHLKVRTPVYFRRLDQLERTEHAVPTMEDVLSVVRSILRKDQGERLARELQADGIYTIDEKGLRFRASIFCQRGSLGVVMRQIPKAPPALADLGLPEPAMEIVGKRRGLILVTGPAASGKTTTVAALLSTWNEALEAHIVTLEDPIEYVLESRRCILTQRQVGVDTPSFASGLQHVMRQDPNIIFVGELRDLETVEIALSAAETGHLVVSTMHTPTAVSTIEQVVGLFPAYQQDQVRTQLSILIQGVLSQVLVPTADRSRRVAAFEVLNPTEAIRNLIRQNQTFRISDTMETIPSCQTLKKSLAALTQQGTVNPDDCRRWLAQ